jgi:hypothetical protein
VSFVGLFLVLAGWALIWQSPNLGFRTSAPGMALMLFALGWSSRGIAERLRR